MDDVIYINTFINQRSMFSPAAGVNDYSQWLRQGYADSVGKAGIYSHGIAQRVHAMVAQQKAFNIAIYCIGPHASAAATALQELTGGVLIVEVCV